MTLQLLSGGGLNNTRNATIIAMNLVSAARTGEVTQAFLKDQSYLTFQCGTSDDVLGGNDGGKRNRRRQAAHPHAHACTCALARAHSLFATQPARLIVRGCRVGVGWGGGGGGGGGR